MIDARPGYNYQTSADVPLN